MKTGAHEIFRWGCVAAAGVLAATVVIAAATIRVSQKNQQFSVNRLEIKAGDRVIFVNDDNVTHNVYSETQGLEFEIELQPPGRADTVQFSRPGIAEVRCAIHPGMKLTVEVKK